MGRRHACRLDPDPLAGADERLRFYKRYWSEAVAPSGCAAHTGSVY
jgi:hypothetical protein